MKRICIGKIATAHGVKGFVKILPYGEDVSLIEACTDHKITLKNSMGKYILAEIEGVQSREAALALKGHEIFIDKALLPEIEEDDTYYYEDLKGLRVVDKNEDDVGTIKAVLNFGAGELLEIQPAGGAAYLLPFNNDNVPEVDLAGGRIVIDNPYDE